MVERYKEISNLNKEAKDQIPEFVLEKTWRVNDWNGLCASGRIFATLGYVVLIDTLGIDICAVVGCSMQWQSQSNLTKLLKSVGIA
jgi:hypothetical protein